MNNFSGVRNRRSLLDFSGFTPIQFPISNYSTSAQTKTEMKRTFEDSLIINNLHLVPDPLKKNLADSVITGEERKPNMGNTNEFVSRGPEKPKITNMGNTNEFLTRGPEQPHQRDYYPSLASISSFFSGVFNVMGAMFQKRPSSSPVPQYYDCFENDYNERQVASNPWHSSKFEVQNKSEWAQVSNDCKTNLDVPMNAECRMAASHCEDKLNQVRLLLENRGQKNDPLSRFNTKHPNMTFIEAGSVKNLYDETMPSEDILLANETFVQYDCPYSYQDVELYETASPKVKTEIINESFDIIQNIPTKPLPVENELKTESSENMNIKKDILEEQNIEEPIKTPDVVSSCEDKLNKLKAMLKTCHNKNKDLSHNNNNNVSKPVAIPNSKITEDHDTETMSFNEIETPDLKKTNCFNEVTGKFYSSSIESEDSFQIVFTESPQNFDCKRRLPSDCESEDSFIMFEETPDSCYTYNDVFGDDTCHDSSDSDSDIEDSECISKLSPNLSRTFGDLTDKSLYSEDVVDYSVNMCDQDHKSSPKCTGMLLNENRKLEKKRQPTKKVHFSTQPPKVHVMRVWAFAARQARAGHWERHALDRERFKRRIADVEMAVSWVLKPQHRSRIVFQRFMPWWNAEKRKELAEKKIEEEHKRDCVNRAEVNCVSDTIDKCEDDKKKKKKEIVSNIDEVVENLTRPDSFDNNIIVDENNDNIHKNIDLKKDNDNDQLDGSVKNNINEIITKECNGDKHSIERDNKIQNFDT